MVNRILKRITFVLIMLTACNYKENIVNPRDVIISMTAQPTTVEADGVSKVLITVQLPDYSLEGKRSITLTTSKGLFEVEGKNITTITAGNVTTQDGVHVIGYVNLITSTDVGVATVKATSGNFSQSANITFKNANPDMIYLQVDKLNYKPDATTEVTLTIQLTRNTGTGSVSINQAVAIVATDSLNNPIGQFRNKTILTDATGKCVNYFSLPLTNNYTGKVIFTATSTNNSNQPIAATAIVNIIK
jgi:hypothetical protein